MYEVKPGDTLARVAQKTLGTERAAETLRAANPGLGDVLQPGQVLTIPGRPSPPAALPQISEQVAVEFESRTFVTWTDITITRTLDSPDTFSLRAPFDPDNADHRAMFRPLSFSRVSIYAAGQPMFAGRLVTVDPEVGAQTGGMMSLGGFAEPGMLADSPPPEGAFPVEISGQRLGEIAARLCEPFGISVDMQGPEGAAFERVALQLGQGVLTFLADLARQRGLIIGSTPEGALRFSQSVLSEPVARFVEGEAGVDSVRLRTDPQAYYSAVTGFESVSLGGAGGQFTVRNELLPGVLRPHVFQVQDARGGDVATAVRAKAARMVGNAVSFDVSVPAWWPEGGVLWAPGQTVTLLAPRAMCYQETELIIRSVSFSMGAQSPQVVSMELVLPEVFSGQMPRRLPWD